MSDNVNGTALPDGAQPQAQAADANGAHDQANGQGEPFVNKAEAVQYFKEQRELKKIVSDLAQRLDSIGQPKEAEKARPKASDGDRVAQLEAKLAFRDALADVGVQLTAQQRGLLETAYYATKPADAGAWLKEYATAFVGAAPSAKAAPAPMTQAPPAQVAPQTNTGAPAKTNELPFDPRLIPSDIWRQMDPKERKRRFEEFAKSQTR